MSVSLKLVRVGAKNNPFYRVVAQTTRSKADGKYIEMVGSYNPNNKEIKIDKEKFAGWIKKGAIVTPALRKLIKK